jgi:hypothetical protein
MEVTIDIPDKDVQTRRSIHSRDEHRSISLHDGPSIAFTNNEVRLYDSDWDQFVSLSLPELVELLAAAYDVDNRDPPQPDQPQSE